MHLLHVRCKFNSSRFPVKNAADSFYVDYHTLSLLCYTPYSSFYALYKYTKMNLRIKDRVGQRVLSFIEKFPFFGG